MISPQERRKRIEEATRQIAELEGKSGRDAADTDHLARAYKKRGDDRSNLYLDTFAVDGAVAGELARGSAGDYQRAADLFGLACNTRERIYSTMGLGNALKETFLPGMSRGSFADLKRAAREKYDECVRLCLCDMDRYAQDYLFVMLEQMNLEARAGVWEAERRPKRVTILHSLESARSHACVLGLCYFAFRHGYEVWEYAFGRVMALDAPEKFVRDRLEEACGAIVLSSQEYSERKPAVRSEVNALLAMKEKGDPIAVFVVELGDDWVTRKLGDVAKPVPEGQLERIFACHDGAMLDIYECRRLRQAG